MRTKPERRLKAARVARPCRVIGNDVEVRRRSVRLGECGTAAALELFHVPKYASVPLVGLVIWLVIVRGSYPLVERILLAIGLVYLAYIVSGLVSHPDWGGVLHSTVAPRRSAVE